MSRKKKQDSIEKYNLLGELKDETIQAILAVIFFVLAFLVLLAAFGKAGYVGTHIYSFFKKLFGVGYFLIPIFFIMLGITYLKELDRKFELTKIGGAVLFFVSGLGLTNLLPHAPGGIVGNWISGPLLNLFDLYATIILLFAILIISFIVTFETKITLDTILFWRRFSLRRSDEDSDEEEDTEIEDKDLKVNVPESEDDDNPKKIEDQKNQKPVDKKPKEILSFGKDDEKKFDNSIKFSYSFKAFTPPPLSLLEKDKGKPEVGDIKANANIIKRTLQNFNISVEMDEISIGPSVTRYALKPAEGVKLSKIVGLNSDLALALAAHPIRIEAPIPGKSLVGIEIPNTTKTMVGLGTLLGTPDYQDSDKPLLVALGKSITGKSYFSNIAKAPHVLIAGATGSGKSVTIHTIITSLLFRNSPENLKFIMIDPKRVELTLYNKIPHLLTPVITDAKKAILSLKWAAKEMSRRYDVLEQCAVRDIDSYHKTILTPAIQKIKDNKSDGNEGDQKMPETMPYIVIVIDELADIMQTYPRELESAIVRLAQMSRAVGIHLILSTQRPSVNVITGLIKANVPTRIALQVASQIDSRTILDAPGAEKLLGAGDTLYQGAEMATPVRLQCPYISETELKKVVQYLADAYKDEIMGEINLTTPEAGKDSIFEANLEGDDDLGEEDDMYEAAREAVIAAGKASTSYIQRKLGVGYSRAARLMDILEKRGVIGPANGSKPREILAGDGGEPGDSTSQENTEENLS